MGNKFEVIALFGAAGAGKDTILRKWGEYGNYFNPIVSCTTRPPREGEVEGESYYFLSIEEFTNKLLTNQLLEATEFRGWHYGTPIDALVADRINLGVFNIDGIDIMKHDSRINVHPVLVSASAKNRLIRQLNREESPNIEEIIRRYGTDKTDFEQVLPMMDWEPEYVINNDTRNGYYITKEDRAFFLPIFDLIRAE